jgi:peptidoglycan/xylan/chitin deacetylase (PgdA/CDA1 family)
MNGAVVLMYHRVADVDADPWELAVRPAHFAEHLDVIARAATVRPLARLSSGWQRMVARRPTVAITFDDGYVDNFRHARPLLERFELPATVFVVTGAMGEATGFWWDTLAEVLLSPGSLPPRLEIRIADAEHTFDLGETEWTARDAARHRRWSMQHAPPTPRHVVFATVWRLLQVADARDRQRAVESIVTWAGTATGRSDDARAMSPDEVAELAAGGLVEIGAHTVTHPVLAALSASAQRAEIEQSRAALETIVAQPVRAFSYPFGSHTDITASIVRQAGFATACTTHPGRATRRASRFALPRFHVRDVPGDEFEREFEGWLTRQG